MKLTPRYVTGIAEGEAAFTYSISGKCRVSLYFAIRLTHADELLLKKIQDFFGVGTIYHVKSKKSVKSSDYTQASEYYRVVNLDDLFVIIKHFDVYPIQGKKRRAYEIWKSIYFLQQEENVSQAILWRLVYALSLLTTKNQMSLMKKSFYQFYEQNRQRS